MMVHLMVNLMIFPLYQASPCVISYCVFRVLFRCSKCHRYDEDRRAWWKRCFAWFETWGLNLVEYDVKEPPGPTTY